MVNLTKHKNLRAIAAILITQSIQHKTSLTQLLSTYKKQTKKYDPFVQEICFGVMRSYCQLSLVNQMLLPMPHQLQTKELIIYNLVIVGYYQMLYMNVPDHATIFETVNACKSLNKSRFTKLVNACLRKLQNNKMQLLHRISNKQENIHLHPLWLLEKIQQAWPCDWQQIINANNQRAPLTIRINTSQITIEQYLEHLAKENIAFTTTFLADSIIIDSPIATTLLPGFKQGWFAVQDLAAQLAMPLLSAFDNMRILDACAAPGGKTCHIAQHPNNHLLALDVSASRTALITDNLTRLKLSATVKTADATCPHLWWDKQPFDRILLDAPCSATGIIRRHPDIKIIRKKNDIKNSVLKQYELLTALWPLLAPNGILLYATCSILPEENWQQIQAFLQKHPDANLLPIDMKITSASPIGLQILPGQYNMDGFFYAKLKKLPN